MQHLQAHISIIYLVVEVEKDILVLAVPEDMVEEVLVKVDLVLPEITQKDWKILEVEVVVVLLVVPVSSSSPTPHKYSKNIQWA
jgi:hypothetical protein